MSSSAAVDDRQMVFVSYSREDAEWRDKFVEMLKPLVRERRLEIWSDDQIVAGRKWRSELEQAIKRSRAALLLVSSTFLASDFIIDQELPALIEHHVLLVPVLVRPCMWENEHKLEEVQWAHDPNRDGPIAEAAHPEHEIVSACTKLSKLLPVTPPRPGDVGARAALPLQPVAPEPLAADDEPGRIDRVPALPATFVEREELAGLREAVLGGAQTGQSAVGVTGKALGMYGQGGIGKTMLAAALAHDDTVRRHFPDGVFWVTVGEHGDLVQAQIDLLDRLGAAHPEFRSAREGLDLLRQALADRGCLLIVDDVWTVGAATAFRATGARSRVLYTSRDPAVLKGVRADVRQIEVLPLRAARDLLASLAGAEELPPEADRVLEATGRVALALALIGAAIGRGGRTWAEVTADLDRGRDAFLDHPYENTFKAMEIGVAALDSDDELAYRSLAVYPEDTLVPVGAVARLWASLFQTSTHQADERLERLARRKLITLEGDGFRFHDLQRGFLLLNTTDVSVMHDDLLAAYRGLLPSSDCSWEQLPPDEPYIWEHLIYHLRGAGDGHGIAALVCDLAYLARRSFSDGPYATESDLRQAVKLYPDDATISWLVRLFRQWGQVFAGHATAADVAATLASRTHNAPVHLDRGQLDSLLPACYLAPIWGLPTAPAGLDRVLEGARGRVLAAAFSPDGGSLAGAVGDGTVSLWDLTSGQLIATLEGHTDCVNSVAFSRDGGQLASASDDCTVRLWEPATGKPIATLEGHTDWVNGVAFSPDGHRLASAGEDRTVRLWDPATGELTATLQGHTGGVRWVAFSSDGRLLASPSLDRTVRLRDAATGEPIATLEGHADDVRGVAFSPDGRLLASAGSDCTVRLWDPATGELTATLEGHTDWVRAVTFSPDGQLASASNDATVRLWDPETGELTATLEGHTSLVFGVAFSPDGRQLASASADGTVVLWDPASGQPATAREGHADWVRGVAFSPDGRLLASAGDDHTVRLWDAATGRLTATLADHLECVNSVAFFGDGRRLASGGDDHTVRLWDLATGTLGATLEGHGGWVNWVAVSPDGRQIASAGSDRTVRIWDPTSGAATATLRGHEDWVRALAFSPDGRYLASAGDDRTIRLWDPESERLIAILDGHEDHVLAVAFSPDSRLLASASDDRTVRLWDPETGQQTAMLAGHTRAVLGVAFSPIGRRLASASDDGTVRLWDVDRNKAVSQLKLGVAVKALAWGPRGITVTAGTAIVLIDVVDHTLAREPPLAAPVG